MADFDAATLDARARYNLITGTVVPRPIALITSLGEDGRVNAAPFSYFNALGSNPPIVAFSPGTHSVSPSRIKDTRRNVLTSKEFVVNMVSEELAEAMTIAAAVFPEDVSETDYMGVTLLPSKQVAPPRIAESPINLECRLVEDVTIGLNRILFGEVVHFHLHDQIIDVERMHILWRNMNLLARMPGGGGIYCRTNDPLVIPRLTYEQVAAGVRFADLDPDDSAEEVEVTQKIAPAIDELMRRAGSTASSS
jgi:flavin reductase (DIM6/NTAB) family NADH-FMN oxidoreductase RutF